MSLLQLTRPSFLPPAAAHPVCCAAAMMQSYSKYEDDGTDDYEPAQPNVESQKQFVASIGDLDKFKTAVKSAADEFLASADAAEFERSVKELRMPIYHQVT